jgi:hypothetical protein
MTISDKWNGLFHERIWDEKRGVYVDQIDTKPAVAIVIAFEAIFNEPTPYEDQTRVRDFRHQVYQRWKEVVRDLLALSPSAERVGTVEQPRVTDNDQGEISVALGGKELRGWSYANAIARERSLLARAYLVGRGLEHSSIDAIQEYQGETWLNALDVVDAIRSRSPHDTGGQNDLPKAETAYSDIEAFNVLERLQGEGLVGVVKKDNLHE